MSVGEEIQYTSGTPEDVSGLRGRLIQMIYGGMGQGATRLPMDLSVGLNPLRGQAANILAQRSGLGGYKWTDPTKGVERHPENPFCVTGANKIGDTYECNFGNQFESMGGSCNQGASPDRSCRQGDSDSPEPGGCSQGNADSPPPDECGSGASNTYYCGTGSEHGGGHQSCGNGASDATRCGTGANYGGGNGCGAGGQHNPPPTGCSSGSGDSTNCNAGNQVGNPDPDECVQGGNYGMAGCKAGAAESDMCLAGSSDAQTCKAGSKYGGDQCTRGQGFRDTPEGCKTGGDFRQRRIDINPPSEQPKKVSEPIGLGLNPQPGQTDKIGGGLSAQQMMAMLGRAGGANSSGVMPTSGMGLGMAQRPQMPPQAMASRMPTVMTQPRPTIPQQMPTGLSGGGLGQKPTQTGALGSPLGQMPGAGDPRMMAMMLARLKQQRGY